MKKDIVMTITKTSASNKWHKKAQIDETRVAFAMEQARDQSTPPDVLHEIVVSELKNPKDPYDFLLLRTVVDNPNVSVTTLQLLMKSKKNEVLSSITRKENITPEMLSELARDPNEFVRMGCALNNKTTLEDLWSLLNDEIPEVRMCASANKNAALAEEKFAPPGWTWQEGIKS